nr:MAG TPA: hypothetical protein [Bacteriophage sp.]
MVVQLSEIIKALVKSASSRNSISRCVFFSIQFNSPPYKKIRRVYHERR